MMRAGQGRLLYFNENIHDTRGAAEHSDLWSTEKSYPCWKVVLYRWEINIYCTYRKSLEIAGLTCIFPHTTLMRFVICDKKQHSKNSIHIMSYPNLNTLLFFSGLKLCNSVLSVWVMKRSSIIMLVSCGLRLNCVQMVTVDCMRAEGVRDVSCSLCGRHLCVDSISTICSKCSPSLCNVCKTTAVSKAKHTHSHARTYAHTHTHTPLDDKHNSDLTWSAQ